MTNMAEALAMRDLKAEIARHLAKKPAQASMGDVLDAEMSYDGTHPHKAAAKGIYDEGVVRPEVEDIGQTLAEVAIPGYGAGRDVDRVGEALSSGDYRGAAWPAVSAAMDIVPGGAALGGILGLSAMGGRTVARNAFDLPENPLVAHHNLSSDGVKVASDIGGIPMPSLAVSRADYPLQNFGDITLLSDPTMASPSKTTGVWDADVYTGRQPRGTLQWVDDKASSRAMGADPDLSGIKDAAYWPDMYDDFTRANEEMQVVQRAISEGVVDVSKYDSFYDLAREAKRKIGYNGTLEATTKYPGLLKYGEAERVLFPTERFTPSGNRKKPQPYTLDRVMRQMKQEKAGFPATESHNTGPSQFRAESANKFRSLGDIKASRDKITPRSETEKAIEAYVSDYFRVKDNFTSFGSAAPYSETERAAGLMQDLAAGRNTEWYGDIPDGMIDEVGALKKMAADLPTDYFEAKPRRAVSLSEFPAAIVPKGDGASQKLLRDAGVREILTYGTAEERTSLFKKFPELLFSAGGLTVGLGAMTAPDDKEKF